MNWDQIRGAWKQFAGTVQSEWGKLTSDDMQEIAGDRTRLVGKIQERYGVAKEEAERQVDAWTGKA